jgi:hypothetical protein
MLPAVRHRFLELRSFVIGWENVEILVIFIF